MCGICVYNVFFSFNLINVVIIFLLKTKTENAPLKRFAQFRHVSPNNSLTITNNKYHFFGQSYLPWVTLLIKRR